MFSSKIVSSLKDIIILEAMNHPFAFCSVSRLFPQTVLGESEFPVPGLMISCLELYIDICQGLKGHFCLSLFMLALICRKSMFKTIIWYIFASQGSESFL